MLCQAILKLHNTASAGFVPNPHTGYIHLLSVFRQRQHSQSVIAKEPEQARSQALPLHTHRHRHTRCDCACACLQALPLPCKPANLLMPCRYSPEGNRAFYSPVSKWYPGQMTSAEATISRNKTPPVRSFQMLSCPETCQQYLRKVYVSFRSTL